MVPTIQSYRVASLKKVRYIILSSLEARLKLMIISNPHEHFALDFGIMSITTTVFILCTYLEIAFRVLTGALPKAIRPALL